MKRLPMLAGVLAAAALMSACSSPAGDGEFIDEFSSTEVDVDSSAADDDTAAVGQDPVSDSADSDGWELIHQTEQLDKVVVVTPDELVADPDDANAVLVRFTGGPTECFGARAHVVEQTPQLVRIRVEFGVQANLPDLNCEAIGLPQQLRVQLDSPLAGRRLEADDGTDPAVQAVVWHRITSTDDLFEPTVVTPNALFEDPDDPGSVLVRFVLDNPACWAARATVVEQDERQVTIRIEVGDTGREPVCGPPMPVELKVQLDRPLRNRSLAAEFGDDYVD